MIKHSPKGKNGSARWFSDLRSQMDPAWSNWLYLRLRLDKNAMQLVFEAGYDKKYEAQWYQDSAIHTEEPEGHLPGLYYHECLILVSGH